MANRIAAVTALHAVLALAGCGEQKDGVPAACSDGPQVISRALERAPAPVTLGEQTRLSTCISRARTDAELQTIGSSLLSVADQLAARAGTDEVAALRLGYLVGATRRGVRASPGLAVQMGRRVEQSTRMDGASAAARAALRRGLQAGEASG